MRHLCLSAPIASDATSWPLTEACAGSVNLSVAGWQRPCTMGTYFAAPRAVTDWSRLAVGRLLIGETHGCAVRAEQRA